MFFKLLYSCNLKCNHYLFIKKCILKQSTDNIFLSLLKTVQCFSGCMFSRLCFRQGTINKSNTYSDQYECQLEKKFRINRETNFHVYIYFCACLNRFHDIGEKAC